VPSLKLNYKEVLSACSDQSLWTAHDKHPQTVPDDPIADAVGNMDLGFVPDLNFGPQEIVVTRDDCYSGGGRREASLLRYKEKRRARLFSKKIRYEVRKLNAEQRPRMKVIPLRHVLLDYPAGNSISSSFSLQERVNVLTVLQLSC
jgi:hypothetical protein